MKNRKSGELAGHVHGPETFSDLIKVVGATESLLRNLSPERVGHLICPKLDDLAIHPSLENFV